MRVKLSVIVAVDKETTVVVCGELESLGGWDVSKALPMTLVSDLRAPTTPTMWTAELDVEAETFEIKFVKIRGDSVVWEGVGKRDNRTVWLVPGGTGEEFDATYVIDGVYCPPPMRFLCPEVASEMVMTSAYYRAVRDNLLLDYNRILPRVIVGTCPLSEKHIEMLRDKEGVTCVMNFQTQEDLFKNWIRQASDEVAKRTEAAYYETYDRLGVKVVWIQTTDVSTLARGRTMGHASLILDRLLCRSPTEVVYVHCNAGVGRSVGCVLAYMANFANLSLPECHLTMSSKRPVAYVDLDSLVMAVEDYKKKFVPP